MDRCSWCLGSDLYIKYHDEEWGIPMHDEKKHYEYLLLESMQSGLSFITILNKRENFRQAFANFDANEIAKFNDSDVERLMQNAGIIRHRAKIEAAINNAKCFLKIQEEFGSFDKFIWAYTDNQVIDGQLQSLKNAVGKTELSDKIAKDLKKRGFKFVGSTTIYAHMQAIGMVNDHLTSCFKYAEVKR